jgi:DNA mismatch repair ATPase MutS
MKAFLMYRDRDFDLKQNPPFNEQALTQDLELNTLFNAMALGDSFLFEMVRRALFLVLTDVDAIVYRQRVLMDCLKNPAIVREIYNIAVSVIEGEKQSYWLFSSKYPASILHRSIDLLEMFAPMLGQLRNIADENVDRFESQGFRTLFATLARELRDEYLASVHNHLQALKFRDGVLISAQLGESNKGTNYVLCVPQATGRSWLERLFAPKPPGYTFHIHPRDESGARALSELNNRGINLVANALAQSTDHILSFFAMLRAELAFYVGCLNLHEQLTQKEQPTCFPLAEAFGKEKHCFNGLYDVCLALRMEQRVVGNDVDLDHRDLVIITGANQGGKSTFLRSIGLSQLMMQSGMFVPAQSFSSTVCDAVFTHFKREEDVTMKSGKFDEELNRMSGLVDNVTSRTMLLFNESFSATNEREGSEIARQVVSAMLERRIKMFFVTHFYEFANGFAEREKANVVFLRAERHADGTRPFKLVEGKPLRTSYGEDLYKKIVERAGDLYLPNETTQVARNR